VFAVKIDDTPAFVGRLIGGLKAHRQRERVEPPRYAARPGSDPADFHFDASKKLNSRQAVAARLTRECQSGVAIRLKTLVKGWYRSANRIT
jgi:hypothetical protein